MERLRCCEPMPHELVHAVQVENDDTTQSVEHAWLLQERASSACGQALPPKVGCAMTRLRFCEPVPHVLVHADQLLKVPWSQSMAHA